MSPTDLEPATSYSFSWVKLEHRIFWALGWFVFNALVVLAYIALYIWSAPTTDGVASDQLQPEGTA